MDAAFPLERTRSPSLPGGHCSHTSLVPGTWYLPSTFRPPATSVDDSANVFRIVPAVTSGEADGGILGDDPTFGIMF